MYILVIGALYGGNQHLNSTATRLFAYVLVSLAVIGTGGCLRMLPNSGVKTVSISRIDDLSESLLLRTGDDQVIRTIVSAIESRRVAPLKFAPEYVVRLEHLDGTTTSVGVLGSALTIDGKTYTSSTDLGTQLQAIVNRTPSASS